MRPSGPGPSGFQAGRSDLSRVFRRVAWSRGAGCAEIAALLATDAPMRVTGDLRRSCVAGRIDALVTRRLGSFDLVPIVVPHQVALDEIDTVTAAVGGGPHSNLAVAVAARIAAALAVPAVVATVYGSNAEIPAAIDRLGVIRSSDLDVRVCALNAPSALKLVESLDRHTLLVVGAPGGSWLQRHLFGAGHRLIVRAPGGALVVRTAPRRCYQEAGGPTGIAIGPHLMVKDAVQLITHDIVPVAEGGILVGIVRSEVLRGSDQTLPVADIMERPRFVAAEDPTDAVADLREMFGNSPIPVVEADGTLLGAVSPSICGRPTSGGPDDPVPGARQTEDVDFAS
jgi:hypothetical protein